MELGTKPIRWSEDGHVYVAYRARRLTFRRDGWDLLPEDGTLLVLVEPTDGSPAWVALTKADITRVFANVLKSASWRSGNYHYSKFPKKAEPFVRSLDDLPERCRSWSSRPRPGPSDLAISPPPVNGPDHEREESEAYLASVTAWRNAWRPERVRVLLVAESHVAEQPGDTDITVHVPDDPSLPTSYCRLVYCVGYGESELCSAVPASNPGTWQFWDVFGAIADGTRQPRKAESRLEERLAWKLRTLRTLRDMGVWLVDASVVGIYSRGPRLYKGREYGQLIRSSWLTNVWPTVRDDCPRQT